MTAPLRLRPIPRPPSAHGPSMADNDAIFGCTGTDVFTDREIWTRIDAELVRLRTSGRHAIRILDAGCGAGGWLLRVAVRARDLGFSAIDGRGFDASPQRIARAEASRAGADDPHVGIRFDVAEMMDALGEEDEQSFDIVLCLNDLLNRLAAPERSAAVAEFARVTDGSLFIAVRAAGSVVPPDVAGAERAIRYRQDHEADRLTIDLVDGKKVSIPSHLFTAAELQALFARDFDTCELVGLDLFHTRFAPDPHWNPATMSGERIHEALARLEHLCSHDPLFLDHAAHVLLHARSRTVA